MTGRLLLLGVLGVSLACRHQAARPSTRPPDATAKPLPRVAALQLAAVAFALRSAATDPVPVCVAIHDSIARYDVPATVLQALGDRGRSMADCPPTYAQMIITPNQPARPPGYRDPYQLQLQPPGQAAGQLTNDRRIVARDSVHELSLCAREVRRPLARHLCILASWSCVTRASHER